METQDIELLTEKSSQLQALLETIHDVGYENFSLMNDDLKNNYIGACANLAGDIKAIAERFNVKH